MLHLLPVTEKFAVKLSLNRFLYRQNEVKLHLKFRLYKNKNK